MRLPAELESILEALERFLPFAGISTFMKQRHSREVEEGEIVVMGVPFDSGATNRPGTRHGPRAIREYSAEAAAFEPIYPWKRRLSDICRVVDFGDIACMPGSGAVDVMLETTEAVATAIFEAGGSLLTLGGDHTIPYGPIRGASKRFGKIALVHLDSHQDSYDSDSPVLDGLINHGTFATGLAKEGCIDLTRSARVYIRTYQPETPGGGYQIIYANDALRMGPEKLAEVVRERVGDAPVYISLDLDALDAASAPGTGSPVPGGPTTGEVRRFLRSLEGIRLVGADLVEVNPLLDPGNITAIAAAYLAMDLLHLLAGTASPR